MRVTFGAGCPWDKSGTECGSGLGSVCHCLRQSHV